MSFLFACYFDKGEVKIRLFNIHPISILTEFNQVVPLNLVAATCKLKEQK